MDTRSSIPAPVVDLADFLPLELVTPQARVDVVERLARLPVPCDQRYAALCAWETAVGLLVDRWEVELVVLGMFGGRRADRQS